MASELRRVFHAHHVGRLRRVYVPPGLHSRVWMETVRGMQQALRLEVERVDGATQAVASRGLGEAVAAAVSRSTLYDRFRRALDDLIQDARSEAPTRFNANDHLP